MGLSRQEVNLRRLLAKCELMCKSKQKDDDRMPKYVESLEDMYQEVKKMSDPNYEFLLTYQRRIAAIKADLGITTSKYPPENDTELLRESLLGVRHRKGPETSDLDQVLNFHENMQQKITDDMLILTKNLKEQSELANKIIKKDTEVVSRSAQLTDQNYSKLSAESNKLAEHSKRAWKCWMWIMLLVVVVVFINMVLFMKVMKKK
ncbi:vesicle transport protein USE1 [Tribolium castaneum]|uniref:Vesicle transport protein USE1 n=1 Tax=Tribolium castaneum TaxID=7070 RepID=A0A139WFD6_TRICA|nr:PREDICTED: vesicle transport protein USE1 [Tribolium castaneum]KYB26664.1 Vesicle transport protein USE1-like Protein [Tribolium castaneum]|eukprot:XP_973973.1 PREDICTED: vesicle transport protein USE1 [Tribolium castaneum]